MTSSAAGVEGAVDRGLVDPPARHRSRTAGAAGIVVARPRHHLAVAGFGLVLRVLGRAVGRRAVGRGLRPGGRPFALGFVFALGFLAVLLLVVLRILRLAEVDVEVLQQAAGHPRIVVLLEDRAV